MGAIEPWQLLCLVFCMLGVTGVVAAVILVTRGRAGRPPRS